MAPAAGNAAAAGNAEQGGDQEQAGGGNMMRFMFQMMLITTVMNLFAQRSQKPSDLPGGVGDMPAAGREALASARVAVGGTAGAGAGSGAVGRPTVGQFRNLYGPAEECDLYVHFSLKDQAPSLATVTNETLAADQGFTLLWHTRVWYETNAAQVGVNVSVGPLPAEVLSGEVLPYVHGVLVRSALLEEGGKIPAEQLVAQSLPLVVKLRELDTEAGAENLFSAEAEAPVMQRNLSSTRIPYFKTKLEVRPVFDQTVHTPQSLSQGPFKRLHTHPELGVYEPYLYISDFWLLEKDYLPLNSSLADRPLNLSLTYSITTLWAWSIQAQMAEQWMTQGEWGLTDTQRDSFMMKRLFLDTNPYVLAFSGAFVLLHTVFSMLAFKNDIQFWRKNESMQGLSARSMCVSFVCQLITGLYLLDSQETSRLILFEIFLDLSLAFWKLRKAVKVEFQLKFPFVSFGGQKGYEEAGTNKYDEEALRYMGAILTPLFIGYSMRSALYGKHRGWYSFFIGSAAGGVYTFGFVMMTPQLYINYKLKSVEHLPWRALTYKAMNTFVDDVFAFLIDMPLMHRLSCLRDDIIFCIYVFQRWKYSVDKTRPSMWVDQDATQKALERDASASNPAIEVSSASEAQAAAAANSAEGNGLEPSAMAAAADAADSEATEGEVRVTHEGSPPGDGGEVRQRR